jgi:uncharacterized membrane protein YvbJ
MICPSCGKQNKDHVLFCKHCGKALPQEGSQVSDVQPINQTNPHPQKVKVSNNAIKAVITVILIVVLIIVVLQICYPHVFPWN